MKATDQILPGKVIVLHNQLLKTALEKWLMEKTNKNTKNWPTPS